MHKPKLHAVVALVLGGVVAIDAIGQTVTTTPVGLINYTIGAGSVAAPQVTSVYFGLTDLPQIVGATDGRITAVSANTLASQGAGWVAAALSDPAHPCYVRITSGLAAGTTWQISTTTASTADTVTVLNHGVNLTGLGIVASSSAGDTFEVIPAATLGTLFGNTLPLQGTPSASGKLAGGPSAMEADTISLWNGSLWLTFYFDTNLGRWRRDADGPEPANNRTNFVIRPDGGVLIARKGDAVTLRRIGRVPASALRARYSNAGDSNLGLFPITTTFGKLNLQSLPGWVGAADSTGLHVETADKVAIWDGAAWQKFYYDTSNTPTPRWRQAGTGADATDYPAQTPERPFLIQKVASDTGSAFIAQDRPY